MCPVGPIYYRRAVLKLICISILCLRGLGRGQVKIYMCVQIGTDNLLEVGIFEHFN